MENSKHIFFDLDHTLWDFDKNSMLAFQQIFEEQKLTLNFDDFIEKYAPINFHYWQLYREEKVTKTALRYGRLKDTFDNLNYVVSDDFINNIATDYLKYLPNNNYLIDGAIELLDYLYPKYKLHIISNGFKEVQGLKLEGSGLKKYFDTIVTSESVGVKKPNPKVFDFALKKADAKPEESVMVGDNYEADVKGAFNVGITPVYFANFNEKPSNHFVSVDRLLDLKDYL